MNNARLFLARSRTISSIPSRAMGLDLSTCMYQGSRVLPLPPIWRQQALHLPSISYLEAFMDALPSSNCISLTSETVPLST